MTKFEKFRCWTADNVRRTAFSDLGALSVAVDPLVLAARVRTELFLGEPGSDLQDPVQLEDLEKQFRALFTDSARNTVACVVGPSGCGKTFVVRWIQAQLAGLADAHVIYVPRDHSSLRQVLKMVLSLPGTAAAEQLRLLEQSSEDLPVELQRKSLVHEMSLLLSTKDRITPQSPTAERLLGKFDEQAQVYRHGLGDLLASDAIADHMVQEGLTVSRLIERNNGNRTDDTDVRHYDFSVADLPASKPAPLRKELDGLFHLLGTKVGQSGLQELLNAARDLALIRVAGIRTDLAEVFSDARIALAEDGKQLVLIFEDIAVSGGAEAQLYNLFTAQPTEGRCPIRVLFAATDGHYADRVPRTVKTRISLCYRMLNPVSNEPLGRQFAERLTANYFGIARLGPERVVEAWEAATDAERQAGHWIPNACDACDHREVCHEEFGAVDGVGLYPLNPRSVHLAARQAQRDNERAREGEGFTPRQLVHRLVEELLPESAAHIAQGSFPYAQLDQVFSPDPIPPQDLLADLISEGLVGDLTSSESKRVARARSIWTGRPAHSATLAATFSLPSGEVAATCRSAGCAAAPITGGWCAAHQQQADLCGEHDCTKKAVRDGRCADHATTARVGGEWPPPALTAWAQENGSRLDPLVDELRDFLARSVQAAVELALEFRPGAKHIVDAYVKDRSFQFANSMGDQRAQNVLERQFRQHPDELPMLASALWFKRFQTWEQQCETPTRVAYQLPDWAAIDGRLRFEQWLDDCRDEVLAQVESVMGTAVPTAVALRTLMATSLGAIGATDADLVALAAVNDLRIPAGLAAMAPKLLEAMTLAAEASAAVLKDYSCVKKGNGDVAAIDVATHLSALAVLRARGPLAIPEYRPTGVDTDVFASFVVAANGLIDAMDAEVVASRFRLSNAAGELSALGDDLDLLPDLGESVSSDFEALVIGVPHWSFNVNEARQTFLALRQVNVTRLRELRAVGGAEHLGGLDALGTLRAGFEYAEAQQVSATIEHFQEIVTEILDVVSARQRVMGMIDSSAVRAQARQTLKTLVDSLGEEK